MNYDPEKTSMAIQEQGGSSLNPLNMMHEDLKTAFTIMGEHKKEAEEEAKSQATLKAEVDNLKVAVSTLQTRLWGLLAVFLGAIITGGVGLWFTGS